MSGAAAQSITLLKEPVTLRYVRSDCVATCFCPLPSLGVWLYYDEFDVAMTQQLRHQKADGPGADDQMRGVSGMGPSESHPCGVVSGRAGVDEGGSCWTGQLGWHGHQLTTLQSQAVGEPAGSGYPNDRRPAVAEALVARAAWFALIATDEQRGNHSLPEESASGQDPQLR